MPPNVDRRRTATSVGTSIFRAGSSRILGVALVVTSVLLFAVASVTGFLPFEIASLISFVLGVSLLAVELEPRVSSSLATDGMLGYLRSLDGTMKAMGVVGQATFVPRGAEVKMVMTQATGSSIELPPVGSGLYQEIEDQLGNLTQKGAEFFKIWIPRTLVDNLAASDNVKVTEQGSRVEVSMSRPFVRQLCVDPFVNANVCCRMGCPLAAALAQALAAATGKEVHFENCTYEPKSQRAETSLSLGKSG